MTRIVRRLAGWETYPCWFTHTETPYVRCSGRADWVIEVGTDTFIFACNSCVERHGRLAL